MSVLAASHRPLPTASLTGHPTPAILGVNSVLFYVAVHAPLAVAMWRLPPLATLHAVITVAIGVGIATSGRADRVAGVIAYIVASEIIWRMANAPLIFWELGKYAVAIIALLGVARNRPHRSSAFPWLYFGALLPSAMLTFAGKDLTFIRKRLSFNLSGPLAMACCAGFFSRARLSGPQIVRVLITALGPLFGVMAITVVSVSSARNLNFTQESNSVASGGYGPNQVSAALGFGALLAVLLAVFLRKHLRPSLRRFLLALALAFATQSALTFSRTGLYLCCLSVAAASVYGLRDVRTRISIIVAGIIIYLLASYVIAPILDNFTHGKIGERFSSLDASKRDRLLQADLELWRKNPLLGVGPGMGAAHRDLHRVAHTEFTRLLSEHGAFGLVALLLLAYQMRESLRLARGAQAKAFTAAMVAYSFLFMAVGGMRLALPCFALGLTFARIDDE